MKNNGRAGPSTSFDIRPATPRPKSPSLPTLPVQARFEAFVADASRLRQDRAALAAPAQQPIRAVRQVVLAGHDVVPGPGCRPRMVRSRRGSFLMRRMV